MTASRKRTLATASLALLLAAGCTDSQTADGSSSPTADATAEATPSPTAADGVVTLESISGEATRLTIDQRVVDGLEAIGVQLRAVGGADRQSAAGSVTFSFPVTGGQATVEPGSDDPFTGNVEHEGGLELSAFGRSVTADALVLDGEQDQVTAAVGGRRVTLLPLSNDVRVSTEGDLVVLSDAAVSLDSQAVSALAQELNLPTLPALQIGQLESTLSGS